MVKKIVTTMYTDDRFAQKQGLNLVDKPLYSMKAEIDSSIEYQTILGFGGAFTEATAITLSKMAPDQRREILRRYFSKDSGLAYNLGRVHIHSCDFALGNYTYVEEHDINLESFSIDHDKELIIPLIHDAMKARGSEIKLLASPWSPPAWMKSNNRMNEGGYLLPEYYQSWANYYVKFIDAYEENDIPIWGITVQNEPEAVQTWDSCIYTEAEERDFVKKYLGPTLYNHSYDHINLLIWDHNRDIMVRRAKTVLEDPEAAKYIWGTGFHWYGSEAFENVGKVHDLFPSKHLLMTEGCQEEGIHLNELFTGERYARNMIGDFNHWCEGYIDWNLVLDETGGPNHVNNLCDAPIICDTQNKVVHYNSSYYYIGHFSKYIDAGAKRIFSDCTIDKVTMVGFKNPNNEVCIVIMNENEHKVDLSIKLDGHYMNTEIEGHSIITYLTDDNALDL